VPFRRRCRALRSSLHDLQAFRLTNRVRALVK
jgi:hypothetical protein